ncbi:MAG: response regulator [Flavobacteriia bacterium]|nr:response regulator [Flavobacteriia bacterium]
MIVNSIFVVDDDPIVVYGLKKLLNKMKENMEVHTFLNGEEAINAIYNQNINSCQLPDIIFLDINMPVMDGWQFLEALLALKIKKKININIVSSTIDPEDLKKIESYKNISPHLIKFNSKPITANEVRRLTIAA